MELFSLNSSVEIMKPVDVHVDKTESWWQYIVACHEFLLD